MRGKLSVQFHSEEGIDAGGVTREWYQVHPLLLRCSSFLNDSFADLDRAGGPNSGKYKGSL